MHFLAHYFLSAQPENPDFTLGVALPDLVRGFSRHYNSHIKNSAVVLPYNAEQIRLGVLHHYAQDAAFHEQPLFEAWQRLINEALLQEQFDTEAYRVFFLNHIAAEFMLDRWLLLHHGKTCDAFYDTLAGISEPDVHTFFETSGLQHLHHLFSDRFSRFMQHRFLYYFSDVERVSEGLCRVYALATQQTIAEEEKHRLTAALNRLDTRFGNEHTELINETKATLQLAARH